MTTDARSIPREKDATTSHHWSPRFIVVFMATGLLVGIGLRQPIYVSTPTALIAGLVAEEPTIKRFLWAILSGAVVAGLLYWQRS